MRTIPAIRRTVPAAALTLALAGCGVPPTGVLDAGAPANGLATAPRVYFVRDARLEGVSRPDLRISHLKDVVKLLIAQPTQAEQERGLTNLVQPSGIYEVTGSGDRITLSSPDTYFSEAHDSPANGQWVCTLARAQAALHPDSQPDSVQVTLDGLGPPLGPYRCSQFLRR
ncbi:GerMN domain-containing protein [Streptomyces sp. NPDC004838]